MIWRFPNWRGYVATIGVVLCTLCAVGETMAGESGQNSGFNIGDVASDNEVASDIIASVVESENRRLWRCYRNSEQYDTDGEMTLKLKVDFATGTVTRTEVAQATFDDESLTQCLTDVVDEWRFPRSPSAGVVRAELPLEFEEVGPTVPEDEPPLPSDFRDDRCYTGCHRFLDLDDQTDDSPPPPRSVVTPKSVEVRDGTVDDRYIWRSLRRNLHFLATCHDAILEEDPRASGHITIDFVVDDEGEVPDVRFDHSTSLASQMSYCAQPKILDHWRFALPRDFGNEILFVQIEFLVTPED